MITRVLLVEDEPIIAYDLAEQLTEAGYQAVGPAVDARQGLALVADPGCDVAVLDVNLGRGQTSESIALELRRRAIPFITVSGYERDQHPPMFSGARLIVKPVQFGHVLAELRSLSKAGG